MSLPLIIYAPWNEMTQIMYSFFVPANSRAFFTANGGFLILFLVSLPSGGRGGGWRRISESMLSGISATARWRIGQSPEKEQNFLYHVHDSTLLYIGHTAPKERNTKSLGIFWRLRLCGDNVAGSRKTCFPSCHQRHHHRHAEHDFRRRQGAKSGLRP